MVVLAAAAVGFVVRSALTGDDAPAGTSSLPAGVSTTRAERFDASAAKVRNAPDGTSLIATAKKRRVYVYSHAGGTRKHLLKARVFNGQRIPLTFSVRDRRKGWVHVLLPTRPNLSSGWVRRKDVRFTFTRLRIVVRRKAHTIALMEGTQVKLRAKVAVGKSLSPTPRGRYFITDIVKPKDPKGFFGTYSLGLSAHSNVYTSFEGGDGQVGIHGTNQPSAIGTDVSHGCIRVTNRVISRLATLVPLGTPVDIAS